MVQTQTIPEETHERNASNDGKRRDLGEKCKLKIVTEETHQRKPINDSRSDKDKKDGGSDRGISNGGSYRKDKHKPTTALEKTQKQKASNDDRGDLGDKYQLEIIPETTHKRKASNDGNMGDLENESKKASETTHKRKTSSDGEKSDRGDTYKPKTHPEKTHERKPSKDDEGDREDKCKLKAIAEKPVKRKSSHDDDRDDREQEKQSKRKNISSTTSFRKSYGDQHLTYINYPIANKIVLLDLLDF